MNDPTPHHAHDQAHSEHHDQPAPGTAQGDQSEDVLSIIAQVENRLAHLKSASRESTEALESIAQKQSQLEEREQHIAHREQSLDERWKELDVFEASVREDRNALDERAAAFEARTNGLDLRQEELNQTAHHQSEQAQHLAAQNVQIQEQRAALETQQSQINTDRQQLESERQSIDQQREELNQQRAAIESQLAQARHDFDQQITSLNEQHTTAINDLTTQLDTARSDVDEKNARCEQLQQQLQQHTDEQARLQQQLDELQSKKQQQAQQLELAKSKLTQLAQAFEEQARQIEANGASTDAIRDRDQMIQQLNEQIAQLESQHAAALEQMEQSTQSLNAQLEELQTQSADAKTQLDEANAQLTAARSELETAQKQAQSAKAELEAAHEQLALERSKSSDSSESDAAVTELTEEIAKRDQAIQQISQHLRQLKEELGQKTHDLDMVQAKLESRDDDVLKLRRQLEAAHESAAQSPDPANLMDWDFLAQRRRRLNAMRKAIGDRSRRLNKARDVVRQQVKDVKNSQDERQTLLEVRRNLELAEQRMVARWARSTTVTQLFILVLTLAVLATGSYFGVMKFWPTDYTANAAIRAKGRPGFPLTDTQVNLWQTVHEGMLQSDSIIESTASRLEQRGYTDLANPATLKAFLGTNLIAGAPQPGTIELSLTATGKDEAQRILETYSIALVSASNAERGRRTDGATTDLSEPAVTNPLPVKDDRIQAAGIVFGASTAGLFLLGVPIYWRLRRSQRIFDASNDLFEPLLDDARWKDITDGQSAHQEHVIK